MQVGEEVRFQSRRLNKYTCMAVWGGNNELEPALGWFPESQENPILYAVNYADTFVNTIRPILCSVDGGQHAIAFVDSSPSNGILSEDPYVKRCAPARDLCTRVRPQAFQYRFFFQLLGVVKNAACFLELE